VLIASYYPLGLNHRPSGVIFGAASIVIAAPFRSNTLLPVVIWMTRPPLIAAAFLLTPSRMSTYPPGFHSAGATSSTRRSGRRM